MLFIIIYYCLLDKDDTNKAFSRSHSIHHHIKCCNFALGLLPGSQWQIIQNYGFIPIIFFMWAIMQMMMGIIIIIILRTVLREIHCLLFYLCNRQNHNPRHYYSNPWQYCSHLCLCMLPLHILRSVMKIIIMIALDIQKIR